MTQAQIYTLSLIGGIALAVGIIGSAVSYHAADKTCDQDRGVVVHGVGGKYHCIKADAVLKSRQTAHRKARGRGVRGQARRSAVLK